MPLYEWVTPTLLLLLFLLFSSSFLLYSLSTVLSLPRLAMLQSHSPKPPTSQSRSVSYFVTLTLYRYHRCNFQASGKCGWAPVRAPASSHRSAVEVPCPGRCCCPKTWVHCRGPPLLHSLRFRAASLALFSCLLVNQIHPPSSHRS